MNATAGRGLAAIGARARDRRNLPRRFLQHELLGHRRHVRLVRADPRQRSRSRWRRRRTPGTRWTAGSSRSGRSWSGYWGFFPAALAFDHWDETGAGLWLTFAGAILIAVGVALPALASGRLARHPGGASSPMLAAGLGIVLIFPSIWLDASDGRELLGRPERAFRSGSCSWCSRSSPRWPGRGASPARRRGAPTWRSRSSCSGSSPSPRSGRRSTTSASVDVGAWLGLAGGILAAGGIWAARGAEMPRTAAAAGVDVEACGRPRPGPPTRLSG